jgi:hypothetical protein
MKNNISVLFIAAIVALTLTIVSCNECVRGEGDPVVQIIDIADFSGIHIKGSADVSISQGVEQRVEVRAPQNIIDLLNTSVRNNTWEVSFEHCIRVRDLEISIITPTINSINISGSGNVVSRNNINVDQLEININGSGDVELMLNCKELTTSISGSGNVKLAGSATSHNATISGSGNINALDFVTVRSDVKIIGSGDADIHATDQYDISIAGSGDVKYKNTGAQINSTIRGSGEITRK